MTHMPQFIRDSYQGIDKQDYALKAQIALDGLDAHPEDREWVWSYAVIYLSYSKQFERCVAVAREALQELKNEECVTTVLRYLARSLDALGESRASIETWLKVLEVSDNRSSDLEAVAECYERLGETDQAIYYYEQLIDEEEGHSDTDIFAKLAALYESKKDFNSVARIYERAGQAASSGSAWIWFNTGRGAALAGRDEDAIFYLRMVLKMDPRDAGAHFFLGQIFQNQSDVYRAMHHYTEALKLQPEYPEVYNNLASIAFNEESNIGDAIRNIETALSQNPDPRLLITLYRNLAVLYNKIADYDKHEYYTGKMMEAIGFPISFSDEDEEEEGAPE